MSHKNPLQRLGDFGQSVWNDNLSRHLITSGELERLIREDGVVGITSNPTIFDAAISDTDDYDEQIKLLLKENRSIPEIYDKLTITDIQMACDILRPVFERTNHNDGVVSLEVPPHLAHDTDETISEARRLNKLVNRPNVMIKIPGTDAGIPAIEQTLYEGININITLLFSLGAYQQVMEAYLSAMERRVDEGKPVDRILSVASFFVSRVDSEVDKRLQAMVDANSKGEQGKTAQALLGQIAIANARLAYQQFKSVFNSERFHELAGAGVRIQRPLWASTSTKNPDYPDTLYIDELIGPNTVQTMAPASIDAFRDHGTVAVTVEHDVDTARDAIETMESLGIAYDDVIDTLVREGVEKFAASYDSLFASLKSESERLIGEIRKERAAWVTSIAHQTEANQKKLGETGVVDALRHHDPAFWSDDKAVQGTIRNRLGWLATVGDMRQQAEAGVFSTLASEVRRRGYDRAVLLGMGGSSLAPEVMATICPHAEGFPKLDVLDTTHPGTIERYTDRLANERTMFIVSSKSGTTVETTSLFHHFLEACNDNAADFVVITDPGTPLEAEARSKNCWHVYINRPDIGGRYSALSYFGLVPATVAGIDVWDLLESANEVLPINTVDHPGIWLGSALTAGHDVGRSMLTVRAAGTWASFSDWLEQLVAESTGKEGKGLIPIAKEPVGDTSRFGDDRLFVHIGDEKDKFKALADERREAGHPVIEQEPELGRLFLNWEIAIATAGHLLGINPFDEPNVQEAKDATTAILKGTITPKIEAIGPEGAFEQIVSLAKDAEYLAIQAFVERSEQTWLKLQQIRDALGAQTQLPTTLGYGPRYLHSTGQLHKGGPETGIFLQIVQDGSDDVEIPGADYSFGDLFTAQANGDYASLEQHGRPVIRINIGASGGQDLQVVVDVFELDEVPAD